MASLRLKREVEAGRIMPNIRKVPSLWSVKVGYSQDFFLLWLHHPKTYSKSLSIRRLVGSTDQACSSGFYFRIA